MDKRARELRKQGIGGSEIAAVAGINPYRTAHDVWMEKVGLVEQSDDAPSEAAYWGQQIEDILCGEYARRENVCLHQLPPPGVVIHPRHSWLIGSPDRLVGDAARIGMDAKMAGLRQSNRWGPEGTDLVPEEYLLQAQWYTMLTDAERWDIAVLLGQQFRIYRITPHPVLQEALMEIGRKFWQDYVEKQVPPPIDHSEGSKRVLRALYPSEQDSFRGATEEEIQLALALRRATDNVQDAEREHDKYRNLLCERIGLSLGLMGPGFRLSWKRTKDITDTDWKGAAVDAMERLPYSEADHIIKKHTTMKPGIRRFRATFYDDGEDAGNDAY